MSSGCSRLLVANRGEIARRVFATARSMGIETVAVYSDGDAAAPFVAEADVAVALGGTSAAESYLDHGKILDAARRTGADAIHPGYGFLSENASFAQAVIDAGLTWVGPPPDAIAAMGDKLAAKKLMVAAGVPTLPSIEIGGLDTAGLATAAEDIGYPVLVKAAAGGGGKGMRVVERPDDLTAAVAAAEREAESSFGDGTVFVEKYLVATRHVEIQVLGDTHGNLVHCFERECSIQRRHQKIVEEAPSPALDPDLRARMGSAALDAVRAVGYHSTGTVEFLVAGPPGAQEFFFLEVNTRLQVEHPVTEEITGLDLVRQQILVATGERLDFTQDDLTIDGHAIEARLYAEDVSAGFLPATGTLHAFAMADKVGARLDSGVEAGSVVGVDFDPMLAKVIVHAPTRAEAAARLALALERMTIAGVTTNRDFLVSTLRHDAFLAGDTTTDFIDRCQPGGDSAATGEERTRLLAVAALVRQAANRADARTLAFMSSGYRNSVMPPQRMIVADPGSGPGTGGADRGETVVAYRARRDGSFDVTVEAADGDTPIDEGGGHEPLVATLVGVEGSSVDAVVDGMRSRFEVVVDGPSWHLHGPGGRLDLIELSPFPQVGGATVAGAQVAPMPGTVKAVAVAVGQQVESGQTLVIMEAMKMEHSVTAPEAGVVSEVRCSVGEQVDNGQVLVVVVPSSEESP